MLDFSTLTGAITDPTLFAVFYSFLLCFILGVVIAISYVKTFQGLSYSRNFLHCLVLCPILTAVAMHAIGDNIARGIGMIGTISLLRFRTNIKDPRDMFFIFAALGIGLAAGTHSYAVAVLATCCFVAAVTILAKTPFAYGAQYDGLLRLNLKNDPESQAGLEKVLTTHCYNSTLVSLREMGQGDVLDYAYHIKLKTNHKNEEFIREIRSIPGAKAVNLMMQESIVEI
jgi:uncharacterized membrane protein YhiD involved in acid resistance